VRKMKDQKCSKTVIILDSKAGKAVQRLRQQLRHVSYDLLFCETLDEFRRIEPDHPNAPVFARLGLLESLPGRPTMRLLTSEFPNRSFAGISSRSKAGLAPEHGEDFALIDIKQLNAATPFEAGRKIREVVQVMGIELPRRGPGPI
jgi:hypothetical protein